MMSIRVLIVDDHVLVRQGTRLLVEAQSDMQVVDEAGDGREALGKARKLLPDVVLMDLALPGMSGLDATAAICHELTATKVLALTIHSEPEWFFEALRAGATGYIVKTSSGPELVAAIRAVHLGAVYLCPLVAKMLASDFIRRMDPAVEQPQFDSLSEREREVLKLVAEGRTSKEIARRLTISVNTVQTHRSHILAKLSLSSRADLIRYALRKGILYE